MGTKRTDIALYNFSVFLIWKNASACLIWFRFHSEPEFNYENSPHGITMRAFHCKRNFDCGNHDLRNSQILNGTTFSNILYFCSTGLLKIQIMNQQNHYFRWDPKFDDSSLR